MPAHPDPLAHLEELARKKAQLEARMQAIDARQREIDRKNDNRIPEDHQQAVLIGGGVGLVVIALAIITPLRAAFDPRFRRNRKSRSGPWRAGWMEPRDIAHLARNKTGMPLALYGGKLLRYARTAGAGSRRRSFWPLMNSCAWDAWSRS